MAYCEQFAISRTKNQKVVIMRSIKYFNVLSRYNFETINSNYVENHRFKQAKIIFENKIVIN